MLESRNRLVLVLVGGLLSCCGITTQKSTGTNWVTCAKDADCATFPGAHCGPDKACVDESGHPLQVGAGGGSGVGGPTACAIDGRTTTVAVVRDADSLDGLAVDDHHAYFSIIRSTPTTLSYEIDAVALPCGAASTLVIRPPETGIGAPVLDNGVLYWIDGGGLLAVPVTGGPPTTLIGSRPAPVDMGGGVHSPAFAVRSGYVYLADVDGTVSRIAVAGGATETLASGYSGPGAIAVDDENVYWASIQSAPASCERSGLDGGDCASVATIFRVPIAGGSVSEVARGQKSTDSILPTPTDRAFTKRLPASPMSQRV